MPRNFYVPSPPRPEPYAGPRGGCLMVIAPALTLATAILLAAAVLWEYAR